MKKTSKLILKTTPNFIRYVFVLIFVLFTQFSYGSVKQEVAEAIVQDNFEDNFAKIKDNLHNNAFSSDSLLVEALQILGKQTFDNPEEQENYVNHLKERKERQYKFIELAIAEGANPNIEVVYSALLEPECLPELITLLFSNNYKKIDPKLFSQYLEKHLEKTLTDYRGRRFTELVSLYANNPALLLDMKYKNLNAEAAATPKIPRFLHHIWVTNEEVCREIAEEDIIKLKNTHVIFAKNGKEWQHIVWTNNKNLIPNSVKKLEKEGIIVRELSEISKDFKLNQEIEASIKNKLWGLASDMLRLEIIKIVGGIYADVNFVFNRDLEREIHRYDFFTNAYSFPASMHVKQQFLAAKSQHQILEGAVVIAKEQFANYIKPVLGRKEFTREDTTMLANLPLTYPYYNYTYYNANRNTVDVLYPGDKYITYYISTDDVLRTVLRLSRGIEKIINGLKNRLYNYQLIEKYVGGSTIRTLINTINLDLYLAKNEICGSEELDFGNDTGALSWLN